MSAPVVGSEGSSPSEVLIAAKMRPSASETMFLMLMWSSASRVPASGRSSGPQPSAVSGAPSVWVTKRKLWLSWSDHMTPILPFMVITEEMSSDVTFGSATGGLNGAAQVVSLVVEWVTQTWLPRVYVAHSLPVESFAIVMDSEPPGVIVTGKPASML